MTSGEGLGSRVRDGLGSRFGGGRRSGGSLEAAVLAELWRRGEPATVAEVRTAVGGDLAYNTVQTILIRLHAKGALLRRRAGRGHVYWPARDEATTAAAQMNAVLAGRPDRQAVLRQFAASLDQGDAELLRALLDDPAANSYSV
ncbi:hypothetical protein Ade02nite_29670 [Paractinoplanes deccanensis]|uniref:CopY family transcriptional regulator n=1 Tax=Paractinoplanes deccanensis TaxID=113561 RepID=A0ABQ3Y2V5_9ACTN|nr:BlaI/MecI/CopY family transcriptional regulator [Actinoplanes deccanensis]GID74326.1 hypothetical protein Ade02nite_29670 [Actinoplanes deccanensis]